MRHPSLQMTDNRIGIVGAGDVSARYVDALNDASGPVSLIFADPDPVVQQRLRDKGQRCFSNMTEMLNEMPVESLLILSPPDTHAGLAIEAVRAGASVVVEKPPALSGNTLSEMADSAQSAGKSISCVSPYRRMPIFEVVRSLLQKTDSMVNIKIMANWPRHPEYFSKEWRRDYSRGGGLLWNSFFHHVDMVIALLGNATGDFASYDYAVRLFSREHAFLDIRGPRGTADLNFSVSLARTTESLRLTFPGTVLTASGRRLSERISINEQLIVHSRLQDINSNFVRVAVEPLLSGVWSNNINELCTTVRILERLHAGLQDNQG